MKFKALLSPKQSTDCRGRKIKANEGYVVTEDKDVIEILSNNPSWQAMGEIKKPVVKEEVIKESIEEIKKPIKKKGVK